MFSFHFAFALSFPRRLISASHLPTSVLFGLVRYMHHSSMILFSMSFLLIVFPLSFLLYSTLVKVSCQLKLSENIGEPVGNHRWAVSGRVTDASDVVSLLSTGIYLTLAHIEDGEGLTVDDFRFDDLDIHDSFPFLSYPFLYVQLYPCHRQKSSGR